MPLDPIILQNQLLLRSFKEAAQEPVVEEILPGALQQPVAAIVLSQMAGSYAVRGKV